MARKLKPGEIYWFVYRRGRHNNDHKLTPRKIRATSAAQACSRARYSSVGGRIVKLDDVAMSELYAKPADPTPKQRAAAAKLVPQEPAVTSAEPVTEKTTAPQQNPRRQPVLANMF